MQFRGIAKGFYQNGLLCRALFLIFIAHSGLAGAQMGVVSIGSQDQRLSLDAHVEVLRDRYGSFTYQDVRSSPAREQFRRNPKASISHGFTTDVYWYRLVLQNNANGKRPHTDWVLEVDYPPLDFLDIYVTQAGKTLRYRSGDQRRPNASLLEHRNFALPLEMAVGEKVVIHLRVQTEGSHQVPLNLWKDTEFFQKTERENLGFGLFYGVILVMSLYNLCIFFFVRDPAYLFYIGSLLGFAVMQMNLNGFLHLYFHDWWVGSPVGLNLGIPLWICICLISGLLFTRSFLHTQQYLPKLDKTIQIGVYILIAIFVAAFFVPYSKVVPLAAAMGAATAITFLLCGVAALIAEVRIARFYVLAWSVFIIGILIKVAELFGLVPMSLFTAYAWQVGVMVLVTLLSLALADRINIERQEKILAQDEALGAREQAIRNLERFERTFKNVLEGVFQTDLEGRCTNANPAVADMLGFESAEELIDTGINLREDCIVQQTDRETILSSLKDGHLSSYEVEVQRKDGSRFWGLLSLRPIRDAEGRAQGIDGILADISASREKQQLEHAREVAETATATKSEFLAKMSHELRTPMNAIIGFTELALRSEDPDRKQEHLHHIDTASHSLLHIINDILDLSKIEAGKLTLEIRDFTLQPILDKLVDLFSTQATEKGIELIVSGHADTPPVLRGDPIRLEQILMNLVSNAVKFTEQGEVIVEITEVVVDGKQTSLYFKVSDTGIGVTEEQKARLFTPFSQADQATSRKYGGTGLGLSICKQLVEMMGGEIIMHSEPGKGSEFEFHLQLLVGEGAGDIALHSTTKLQGKRILIVDDNAAARQVYSRMLETMRFETRTAESAEDGMRCLSEADYDAVLMDWRMPGMDGIEATRHIREIDSLKKLPVVLMTAHGREDLVEASVAAGANSYLEKPVKPSLLLETMQVALDPGLQTQQESSGAKQSRTSNGELKGLRILLAEDNELNRELVREILGEEGVLLDMAENGEIAVNAIRHQPYDIVLMDMQMPQMDGLLATRAIREMDEHRDLPIIAMTANAMERDREECMQAGMNDFLPKPIDAMQLIDCLAQWRQKSR